MSRWSLTRISCVDAFLDAARLSTIRSLLPGQVPAWMTWVAATSKESADFAEHGAMKRRSCHVYKSKPRNLLPKPNCMSDCVVHVTVLSMSLPPPFQSWYQRCHVVPQAVHLSITYISIDFMFIYYVLCIYIYIIYK